MADETSLDRGRIFVLTENNTMYEIDSELGFLRRHPSESGVALRRDGRWIKLLGVEALTVGKPARFRIEALNATTLGAPTSFTWRVTGRVISILRTP